MTTLYRIMDVTCHALATSGLARWERLPDAAVPRGRGAVSDGSIRRLNVLVALIGIVVTLPLMVLIALAVKLTSAGPVLFRQQRVGHDRRRDRGAGNQASDEGAREKDAGGRIFTMYKFRTMVACENGTEAPEAWASPDDFRITPIGSFLRTYRLDELPQLFNVLRGDMNVVGPRPEQPMLFRALRSQVERYPERQVVLPGITGWAQVNQSYDQCLDDVRRKVDLDLEYIRRRSPAEDLRIMARTLPVMMGKRGAL
jgi:lipopolysaccharide/colanic/teichoic acid biosynthesis glycosyltransferase